MSGGQQNSNSSYDNSIGWALLLIVFAVLAWLVWYFFDTEIRNVVRWIRYGQMWLISWFVDNNFLVSYRGSNVNFEEGFVSTRQWSPAQLKLEHLSYFNALTMHVLKFPIMGVMIAAGVWVYFKGPRTQYRQKLSVETIITRHSNIFPVISPFINFNPSMQPPRPPGAPVPAELPLFAEALGPEEWVAYNSIPVPDGEVDGRAAAKAFTAQLGKRWRGVNALPPYKQILMATFCLKASRKRDRADEFMGRLALCWCEKKGISLKRDKKLLKEARAVLRNKDLAQKTLQKANQHAFEATAVLRALSVAREEGGVLAPAQFVWLRAHDRALWYPLNNLGRQAFHMEALGVMSHFKAERLTNRPIPVPKIDGAVETIQEYMRSKRARPIPKLDYAGASKRAIKKAR